MKSIFTLTTALWLCCGVAFSQQSKKTLQVSSPDSKLQITVDLSKTLSYSVTYEGEPFILDSPISLTLQDGSELGKSPRYRTDFTFSHNRFLRPIYGFESSIQENCNELIISFKGDYSVAFRAFNDGMAYRWITKFSGGMIIKDETATFNFADNFNAYFHPDKFDNSFESDYELKPIDKFKGMSSMPLLVELPQGRKAIVMESDLLDYPGMHLVADSLVKGSVKGVFANHPKNWLKGGMRDFNLKVTETHDFIAQTNGSRSLPWRIVGISNQDQDLLKNQLVYILASDSKIGDISWIKPGKVSWDWWNALNLFNVPFKTGINNKTYEYYIDFAAENKLEYVILDEGWSDPQNMFSVKETLDLPELAKYAKEKNVRLILWCVWHTLDRQMEDAFELFEKWGIAGVKVDFIDRDDQVAVNFYEKTLKSAADHKLLVDFHGAFKPTGLEKTYPNCITREGVKGLEWNKFSDKGISPDHDVLLPFTRMVAGPMDYTPGAMQNMTATNWRMINEQPMSQGTRCHQLAMYVIYYSPLQMLSDSPTTYQDEIECMHFLSNVPTVWSETVPLTSKVGDYVTIARKNGNKWWLGSMTDWTATEYDVKLSFLDAGTEYEMESFVDGPNSERDGRDYQRKLTRVKKGDTVHISMSPGGGFAACFKPVFN